MDNLDQNFQGQETKKGVLNKVVEFTQKSKIIIVVTMLIFLSLSVAIFSIYQKKNQIVLKQKSTETKNAENSSEPVSIPPEEQPFLKLLDIKNQVSAESNKEPTAIALSGGVGCQPDFFDPQTAKYDYLQQTPETGSFWAKDIYQLTENGNKYHFTIKSVSTSPYTITDYEFGCASSWDHVLDVRKDNKRTALYTHVNTFYLNDNKDFIFLDNYLKNQKGEYDRKRRIISVDGLKKVDLPFFDCISRWAKWDENNNLLTYSQGEQSTPICVWDTEGNLKYKLQGRLTWYGASSDSLWAEIGTLPKDPNIFYAYDNNFAVAPRMCALFLQDLTNQSRNKKIDLFLEGSDSMPQHLCPPSPGLKFDISKTTFASPLFKFKIEYPWPGTIEPYYKKYESWQTPPNPPLQSPSSYKDENVSFEYPSYLIKGQKTIGGSGYSQEFKEENGQYTLAFSAHGNYNQITGKPYSTIDEYIGMPYQVKTVTVAGQEGRQPLPRAGSENDFSASFFSKDAKLIFTIDLEVPKDELKINDGQKMFDRIISTFRFSDTK